MPLRNSAVYLVILASSLGLAFVLASAWPAVAEMVDVAPLPPVRETDGRAGACYSFYYDLAPSRPFIPLVYDAGSRWDRFDFSWPTIEPGNNNWNFGPHDTLVNDLHGAGMNIVGILLWTPNWAATQGLRSLETPSFEQRLAGWYAPVPRAGMASLAISAASSPPRGLYLPWNDPNNHWGNYVYTVVSHYEDRVKHWEMWNEADDYGWEYFWTGTDADYAQLLKVGYQATKAACPDCTVLFAGLLYWRDSTFFERVLDILNDDPAAPGNNYFFDAMSVHLYSRSSNTYDVVNHIRSRMKVYVPDHPLWLTETGVPVWNDVRVDPNPAEYDYAATQEEAAAYVIQSYANAWAASVEQYFFFRTHDADMGEYFGLIRNDHTLRPAYVAYQVATTYLISPTFTTRVSTGSHLRVTLWGTPRGKVSVLWNASSVTGVYTLPATLPTATFVDRWGITRTVTATVLDGRAEYTTMLPGATANLVSNPNDYIIGGDPLIVIESEMPNEPPTSTVHALPEITYSPTFTVTWEGWDNQSGVKFYDVQVRDGDGEWEYWQHSTTVTSGLFTGQRGHTYSFRVRATDRVGNQEAWPEEPQAYTVMNPASTLYLSIGAFFADENRNSVWDELIAETNEITLTAVALRFVDEAGLDVVSPTVGSSWEFTTTVYTGQTYRLWATSGDYMRMVPLTWFWSGEVLTETYPALGLWPVTRTYLPLVFKQAPGGM